MELLPYLHKLFAYDAWANREVASTLASAPQPLPRALRLMAHVVGTEWTWRSRTLPHSKTMAVWPQLSAQDIAREVEELQSAWQEQLGQLSAGSLTTQVEYSNTKGERFRSSLHDILMHVIMHSAYHRGQIAADMRASGAEPVYTDFIHAVRQGLIKT